MPTSHSVPGYLSRFRSAVQRRTINAVRVRFGGAALKVKGSPRGTCGGTWAAVSQEDYNFLYFNRYRRWVLFETGRSPV